MHDGYSTLAGGALFATTVTMKPTTPKTRATMVMKTTTPMTLATAKIRARIPGLSSIEQSCPGELGAPLGTNAL